MPNNKLDLNPLIKDFTRARNKLPLQLGNQAVKFFRDNFTREGFLDRTVTQWAARKYTPRGGAKTILQVTGALKRSIQRLTMSRDTVTIGTKGVRYAQIHNDGLNGRAWGKHPFKMPKHQFIGKSFTLEKQLLRRINAEISKFAKTQK